MTALGGTTRTNFDDLGRYAQVEQGLPPPLRHGP